MGKARRLKSLRSTIRSSSHSVYAIGYSVDLAHLLFTRKRDFLVRNNTQKVWAVDLKGKSIVLVISPCYEEENFGLHWDDNYWDPLSILHMVDAYNELMPKGGIEFVFVPVYLGKRKYHLPSNPPHSASKEAIYKNLVSTMPWPAVPFYDAEACGGRVAKTFNMERLEQSAFWVIFDPTGMVVATEGSHRGLFKLFGGAELYPLSRERIRALWDDFGQLRECNECGHRYHRCESRKRVISKWDQLLASPTRNFLLSSNGHKVPISSLQGKVVGLYFCENRPNPPRMEIIKKVYEEAKSRGYKFEIVQINFHYHFFDGNHAEKAALAPELCYENINWLRLPFKDSSCRKLQRMFECRFQIDFEDWYGDCLVIIHPRKADSTEVLFEFSGAEILEEYGIEGYPFTRQSLFEVQHRREKKELRLQALFPPGLCHLVRPAGDGFDATEDCQLTGKKVLVLLAKYDDECQSSEFVSMLKSKYCEQQVNDVAEEDKFEVVYVSLDYHGSSFDECVKDMPWLVHPHRRDFGSWCNFKIFKHGGTDIGAAAFDRDGGLIAKKRGFYDGLGYNGLRENEVDDKFPFVSQDWEGWIKDEVEALCQFDKYRYH